MEELKIIDCKISPDLITQLIDSLLKISQLKRFSLVGVKHNTISFEKVVSYIENDQSLEEIDLSN